jgi:hypothetical protein
VSTSRPGYGQIDREYAMRLAADDRPVWMVNLMRYKPVATYDDGGDGGEHVTGREADDRYAPVDVLADIGATIVLVGDVTAQQGGEPAWDRVGIVRYPTGRSFIEMQLRKDFQAQHVHKEAGMERTIVLGCSPRDDDSGAYDVDGTIVGDGRAWDAVRIERVADRAVRVEVTGGAGRYTLDVAPTIDALSF